jgi:gluconolactonase
MSGQPGMASLSRPPLARLADVDAHEGPVYVADEDALYFTTLPRPGPDGELPPRPYAVVKRLPLEGDRFPPKAGRAHTVPASVTMPNGMTQAPDGALVVCEQGDRRNPARISRLDRSTYEVSTLVDHWHGLRLNSPNDVVVRFDGTVWFTDPSYGHLQGFRPEPQAGDFVYRYDPRSGELTVVADDLDKPNGIAFSPDGTVVYLTDSGANQTAGSYHVDRPHHVLAYDVTDGRRLRNRRLLAVVTPGFPDGITADERGRLFVSSDSGVQVFSPDGDPLGQIEVPATVNVTFGHRRSSADRAVLFITTDTAVWAAEIDTTGA